MTQRKYYIYIDIGCEAMSVQTRVSAKEFKERKKILEKQFEEYGGEVFECLGDTIARNENGDITRMIWTEENPSFNKNITMYSIGGARIYLEEYQCKEGYYFKTK